MRTLAPKLGAKLNAVGHNFTLPLPGGRISAEYSIIVSVISQNKKNRQVGQTEGRTVGRPERKTDR